MVRKPNTYVFCEFVMGKYQRSDTAHLRTMFSLMSYSEKMDILSMNFGVMWYRLHKVNPDANVVYYNKVYQSKKHKFETSFLSDNGCRLKSLISNSYNADSIWELPKGRKISDESDLNSAIREFEEETGLSRTAYSILYRIPPYIESYTDFGTTYIHTYYFATASQEKLDYKFDINQIKEVSAVQWCTVEHIKYLNLPKKTLNRLLNMWKILIKRIRMI
jgi:ADP-ribose pyrophosphatase YjhB (NUDIX family)